MQQLIQQKTAVRSSGNLQGDGERTASNQTFGKAGQPHSTTLPSPQIMHLRGKAGGYACAAQHDPREYTARARSTFLASFEKQVDPDGVLPEGERLRRAQAAKSAHFAKMALKSAKKRSRKARKAVA